MNQKKKRSSLENALELLDLFTDDEPELNGVEIAEKLGVSNSAVSRLTSTLCSEGFLTKEPRTNLYRLGTSILALSSIVSKKNKILSISQQMLENLVHHSKESAYIGILKDFKMIFLKKVEGFHPIQLFAQIGKENPAHCTAIGQLLLAYQTPQMINSFNFQELEKFTSNTITSREDLLNRMKQIKNQGHSICIDELFEGMSSIAAPVRDSQGNVFSAICIIGRTQQIKNEQQYLISLTKNSANNISKLIAEN